MRTNIISSGSNKGISYFTRWDRHLLSFTHELSSPLTAAQINLDDYLLSGNTDGLKLLSSNLKLMEDYLNTARLQIKHQALKSKSFLVGKQLNLIARNLSPLARKRGVEILVNSDRELRLKGNTTSFKQITACVIKNGIESYSVNSSGSKLVIINSFLEKGYLVITVSDDGQGVRNIDEIFKPYYSSKHGSDSMGIGLSLASESISEDYSGHISVSSSDGHTTTFRLHFLSKKLAA